MFQGDVPETGWSSETSSDLDESMRSTMRTRANCEQRREGKIPDPLRLIGADVNEARNSPNSFLAFYTGTPYRVVSREPLPSPPWGESDTDLFVSTGVEGSARS